MQTAAIKTYNDLELALMVLLGYMGNGADRVKKLGDRYSTVQKLVQQIIDTQKIPSGSSYTKDQVTKAVQSVLNTDIKEFAEAIKNELK